MLFQEREYEDHKRVPVDLRGAKPFLRVGMANSDLAQPR
jgi:hypothetical protein